MSDKEIAAENEMIREEIYAAIDNGASVEELCDMFTSMTDRDPFEIF